MSGAFMIHNYYSYIIYYIIYCIPFALKMSGAFIIKLSIYYCNHLLLVVYFFYVCIPFALKMSGAFSFFFYKKMLKKVDFGLTI